LTWASSHLSQDSAFVQVPAKLAKNSKTARQPVTSATVAILQSLKAEQGPKRTDRDGNEISFHSLRNSYISFLANSRTPPKTIQKLARHSGPKLTFNVYGRSFEPNEKQAIKQLPDMADFAGQFCLARCLAHQDAQNSLIMPSGEKQNGVSEPETPLSRCHSIAPRGFEPLLPG